MELRGWRTKAGYLPMLVCLYAFALDTRLTLQACRWVISGDNSGPDFLHFLHCLENITFWQWVSCIMTQMDHMARTSITSGP